MAETTARLQEIINAYIERDGSQYVDTGIVAGHVAQMKPCHCQGVEFFPSQAPELTQRLPIVVN